MASNRSGKYDSLLYSFHSSPKENNKNKKTQSPGRKYFAYIFGFQI